jgi:hypothetical protein
MRTILISLFCLFIFHGIHSSEKSSSYKKKQSITCDFNWDGKNDVIFLKNINPKDFQLKLNDSIIDTFNNINTSVILSQAENRKYTGKLESVPHNIDTTMTVQKCGFIVVFEEESSILYLWDGKKIIRLWLSD